MPKFTAKLSVSSLDKLLSSLKAYREKVTQAPTKIVENLADFGENQIQRGIQGITDKDGNYLAKAGSYVFGDAGLAYMEGDQSAYLEYGTGIAGKNFPHPQANEAGWQYNSGKTINPRTGDWSYWDAVKGKHIHTKGIPAQMPVFNAALEMRGQIVKAAKEALN